MKTPKSIRASLRRLLQGEMKFYAPPKPESAGCSTCRTATAASRRSAAVGARCPSTAAARTSRRTRSGHGWRGAVKFLGNVQRADGSWLPLWFGNEHAPDDENPTYGTARVVRALTEVEGASTLVSGGVKFLLSIQNADGGWSGKRNGPASNEETALAVEALARAERCSALQSPELRGAARRGADWLMACVESGAWCEPSPIGFYFAKLWYFERLYPLIFTVGALRAVDELDN